MTWELCDEPEVQMHKRLDEWMSQIDREGGWDIYNEEELGKKLTLVNERIAQIEKESDTYSGDDRFLFLGLSDLDKLCSFRWKLRNQLLACELPDREVPLTDREIELARSVPLSRFFPNLPKHRKIICPYHKEKTPSFHVYDRGYCFGCRVTIDSIQWQMDQLGLSFVDTVKALAVLGI